MNTTAPYPVGALIVYGGSGVCRVIGVGVPEGQSKTYYTLAPLYGTEVIYAPVDTRVFLRPVLTKEEADDLIRSMPSIRAERVETGNLQLRSRQYQASFQSHDAADLVKLIKTIHWRDAAAPGRAESAPGSWKKSTASVRRSCSTASCRQHWGSPGKPCPNISGGC